MNLQIETRLSDQIARYLDLSVSETKLTATNMANIDTPEYQTLGLDFASEMRNALDGIDQGNPVQPARVSFVDGLIARPDGNNVSMDREGLHLAETQLKFRTGVALMRLENQSVMDAIHADR